jgi:replicative DNA helicase
METMDHIASLPFHQIDNPRGDLSDLKALIVKMVKVYGCKLIFIDHLQLIRVAGYKNGKVQEMGEITRALKLFTKEFNVPIVLLSQLNRMLENRQDKRPHLSDLRESGDIEQDADLVMFVYRDEYYYPDTTLKPKIMEIITAKNRHGNIGTVELYYEKDISLLASLSRDSNQGSDA